VDGQEIDHEAGLFQNRERLVIAKPHQMGVTGVPRFNTRALAECSLESSSDSGACG
jgi:hypothetical protein